MALNGAFSHMVFQVSDLDRSEAFYRDVIGLDVVGRNLVADNRPNSLLAMTTRQRVLLVEVPEVPPIPAVGGSTHHGWLLTIEQFEDARKRLEDQGFETGIDPRQRFRALGEYNMDIEDPDGNRFQLQAFGEDATQIIPSNAGVVDCGKIDEFAVGSVTRFGTARFFLARVEEGFLAISAWCTHKNGITVWQGETWNFYCPFHGAKFDRKGCYIGNMGCAPMRLHPVAIGDDGTVSVDTNEFYGRSDFDPAQAVPAEPGAKFRPQGLERLPVAGESEAPAAQEA